MNPKRNPLQLCGLVLLFTLPAGLLATQPPDPIVPISSSISLNAFAEAGGDPESTNSVVQQGAGLGTLSTTALAQSSYGGNQASTESDATAIWASPGSVQLTLHTGFSATGANASLATGSAGWFYSFTANQDLSLTLHYQVAQTGPYPYLFDFVLNVTTGNGTLLHQFAFPALSSGTDSLVLPGGTDYTFQLFDDSNAYQNPFPYSTDATGTYGFNLTPIPESRGVFPLALAFLGVTCFRKRVSARP